MNTTKRFCLFQALPTFVSTLALTIALPNSFWGHVSAVSLSLASACLFFFVGPVLEKRWEARQLKKQEAKQLKVRIATLKKETSKKEVAACNPLYTDEDMLEVERFLNGNKDKYPKERQ